jgi:hypothetical protein
MKRIVLCTFLVLVTLMPVTAQINQNRAVAATLGRDTAQQLLQEVSISRFEDSGFWRVSMPIDHGVIEARRFAGGPLAKQPLAEEEEIGIAITDEHVLGVKATFFRRQSSTISVQPIRPLQVPGIAKTISVWVVGRNFDHRLAVVVADYFGNVNVLDMGKLNHAGWKQMTTAIPPTLVQRDPHFVDRMGVQILGFMIVPEMMQTYGTYYVYFDGLTVLTDLFPEHGRDPDDMIDSW